MEPEDEIEFSDVLEQAARLAGRGEAGSASSAGAEVNPEMQSLQTKEKLDWRIKLTLGLILLALLAGVGFTLYILNPPHELPTQVVTPETSKQERSFDTPRRP